MTVRYHNNFVKVDKHTSIRSEWDRSLSLKIKDYEAITTIFFILVAICLKAKWRTHVP